MLFVRVDDLKAGMRLGKPIYNKNGVLLHERGSKLTIQSIFSIKNFGLMGLFILEPAEPIPPMSDEDINFERFQTMAVFSIREDLELIASGKKAKGLDWLCNLIMKNYGKLEHKINFIQSLRSKDDFVYKHSLNVAILSVIAAGKMNLPNGRINRIVKAAVLHDVGMLRLPLLPEGEEMNEGVSELTRRNTIDILSGQNDLDEEVITIIKHVQELRVNEHSENPGGIFKEDIYANIIFTVNAFDHMTAMKTEEEPTSEITAMRELRKRPDLYDTKVIEALMKGINILSPGVCVELTNRDKGLVIIENENDIFSPYILSFNDNQVYNLSDSLVQRKFMIKDVMKSMDNRVKMDPELIKEYMMRG